MVNKILRLLVKLIFPDFSNRITWLVVFSGVLIMSPGLSTLISELLIKKYLDSSVNFEGNSIFGLILIISGLLHNLLYQFIGQSKVINGLNPSFRNDEMLFNKFIKLLPASPVIENLKWVDFFAEVERVKYEPLRTFMHRWDNAEHVFNDSKMEKDRSDFLMLTHKFFELIGAYTIPVGYNSEYASVQDKNSERSQEFECRNKEQADEIHEILESLILAHKKIIILGKEMYLVDSLNVND
ncbi:MAG: hypothetical protein HRU38_13390 [Saccharospirillaceae bacterium]|nr:hypothetical protein [Pseudomonadales bacterium]NRB79638.1 hypothetical protein [Saccharospirillaceae bacterium]